MSDSSGAWYHCIRCGSLFKAAADPETRGLCPECGLDPTGDEEREAPPPVRIRRKVRKPRAGEGRRGRSAKPRDRKKERALVVFVVLWMTGLGALAIKLGSRAGKDGPTVEVEDFNKVGDLAKDDFRLIQEQLDPCGKRLGQFLAASDIGGRSAHVLRAELAVQRMARFHQFSAIFPSNEKLEIELYHVIHTPIGRAIETLWTQESGERIEAVFFQEEGEWKLDWDAYARAGTEAWPLFLAGRGTAVGEFRLLARERIGANGRDPEFIGLVLYATRPGHPEETLAPSPEIRVPRDSPVGRQLEDALKLRESGVGAFGSKMVKHDPADMIRLRARIRREGEDERVFRIEELFATHWLQLDPPKPAAE